MIDVVSALSARSDQHLLLSGTCFVLGLFLAVNLAMVRSLGDVYFSAITALISLSAIFSGAILFNWTVADLQEKMRFLQRSDVMNLELTKFEARFGGEYPQRSFLIHFIRLGWVPKGNFMLVALMSLLFAALASILVLVARGFLAIREKGVEK